MATDRRRILVSFTDEEMAAVKGLADQVRLSVSELLRRLSLGHRLPDSGTIVGSQAIRDLLKVNADQARLGNLMKLALDDADGAFTPAALARIDALLAEIVDVQATLKSAVKDIHQRIHPRAAR